MDWGLFKLFGGSVKSYKQTLMSIFVVFATAYVLTLLGCAKSTDVSGAPPAAPMAPGDGPEARDEEAELQPIDPKDMRECTSDEFQALVIWSDILGEAKQAIKDSGGRRSESVVKLATRAIQQCDQAELYHTQKPCKKTVRTVVDPDQVTLKGAYDAFNIDLRCKPVESYLKKFNLRPDPNQTQPLPVDPVRPDEPAPIEPDPSVDLSQIGQCSSDEFSKLNAWRAALDKANANVAKLGNRSNWKFDAAAVDSSKAATIACENLISYHQARPCKREKTYTAQGLRELCTTVRTYYYRYAQRGESLIVANARLYLNTSIFEGRAGFQPGPSSLSYGQCVITNTSSSLISYQGQKALVTEARVLTSPEYQMFVLQTQEGLKLECYGVDYASSATSLTEVMKLLKVKDTILDLSYELN